ncbi:MAG TPA: hypothetical protein VGH74_02530 [Planctomycetaceae bacterium]|jgi:hypothetical protein
MNLGQQFTNQWQSDVSYQLSCFDRVILTGYLPFWNAGRKDRNVLSDLYPRLLDHAVVNFRAQDIMTELPTLHGNRTVIRRRQAQAVSRRLKRLHIRGLIAKILRSHRWRASTFGQRLLTKVVRLYYHGLSQAA